mgnify:CR=1 FL=1|jgi:putative FmdB family regulatory protein
MPKMEYKCAQCHHSFQRVVLLGGPEPKMVCPKCKGDQVKPEKGSPRLFKGIAGFSSLSKDTN